MFMPDIISKKKHGEALNREEIHYFIKEYVANNIPDYQASALLMAIYFNGMNKEETAILTDEMMHSGEVMNLSKIKGITVDKHSTGGVGDKTSLVLTPLVASLGGKVAKLSGRGLGHTGGTIDKLESIPGFSVDLTIDQFINQVNRIGLAIMGQTKDLVPADKKLYALRDVTATVDSIPLIASSIMSKKLATGTDEICLDVKYGSGAFCKDTEMAEKLAKAMVDIGKAMHKDTRAYITNMDEPLGNNVGNIIELLEVIETLHGRGAKDLRELCIHSACSMLVSCKIYQSEEEALPNVIYALDHDVAFDKFIEFVEAQGGDSSYIKDPSKFGEAKNVIEVLSDREGFVQSIDTIEIGSISQRLGGGRATKEDLIDFQAGLIVHKKVEDYVKIGEPLVTLYTNHESYSDQVLEVLNAYTIGDIKVPKKPLVYKVIK